MSAAVVVGCLNVSHNHVDCTRSRLPRERWCEVCKTNKFSPESAWQAIRTHLCDVLGEREWEMWIRHVRLMRMLSGTTMLCAMPRNGRAIFGAMRHRPLLRKLAAKLAFGLVMTVEPDDYQIEWWKERYKYDFHEHGYMEPAPSELWQDWSGPRRKAAPGGI